METFLKESLEKVYEVCDILDNKGYGLSSLIHTSYSTSQFFEMDLINILLMIATSDGTLSEEEACFLNEVSSVRDNNNGLDVGSWKALYIKNEIDKMKFKNTPPISLQIFIKVENSFFSAGNSVEEGSAAKAYIEAIKMFGIKMMAINGVFDTEINCFVQYMKMIYQYVKETSYYALSHQYKLNTDVRKEIEIYCEELAENELQANNNEAAKSPEIHNEEREDSLEELLEELEKMVGLDTVKQDVNSLVNFIRIRKIKEERGIKQPNISMHLVFYGNPGTGKTTVARLLAKIYKQLGVLSKGQLVEVDRSGLVGGYVGQTAIKTQGVIQQSLGGILFIDEAYSLTNVKGDNDYGKEAIETILKGMEDNREDFIVIVAGYTELMGGFLDSNPGLRSRFNKYIQFKDYSNEELVKIFNGLCTEANLYYEDNCKTILNNYFNRKRVSEGMSFANGREARNLFERVMVNQANRLVKNELFSEDDIKRLTAEDFE